MSRISEPALDVKNEIIEKIARENNIPIRTVRAVIDNQFKTAMLAINIETSIEIANFGRFTLIEARVKKRKEKYLAKLEYYDNFLANPEPTEHAKELVLAKRISLQNSVNDLIHKENVFETKRNSRRLEK